MLEKVKMALRITTDAYDDELEELIDAAQLDMGIAGVIPEEIDPIVSRAIITYCKMSFGLPEDYDKLKASYDEQKAQLSNATGYTDWSVNANVGRCSNTQSIYNRLIRRIRQSDKISRENNRIRSAAWSIRI